MKETNEYYYTVTTTRFFDQPLFNCQFIKVFNTGSIQNDRTSAIAYINGMKSEDPLRKFQLSLIKNESEGSYMMLILYDDLKRDNDFMNLCHEKDILESSGLITESHTELLYGSYLLKDSQELIDLLLKDEFEYVLSTTGAVFPILQLFEKYGNKLVNYLLIRSIEHLNLRILIFCHQNGADLSFENDLPLRSIIQDNRYMTNCLYSYGDIVLYLISNISTWINFKDDILRFAIDYGHVSVIDFLFRNIEYSKKERDEMFCSACWERSIDVVKYIFNKLDDFESISNKSLQNACYGGCTEIAIFLLDMGTDISGNYAKLVQAAASEHMLEFVKCVVEKVDSSSDTFVDALNVAIDYGCLEVVIFLLEKGTRPNEETIKSIEVAAKYGTIDEDAGGRFPESESFIESIIESVIKQYPEYKSQLAKFFTPKLKEMFPEYATGADFNLF